MDSFYREIIMTFDETVNAKSWELQNTTQEHIETIFGPMGLYIYTI